MKKKDFVTHILGSLLVLSSIYHSYTLYSLLVVVPLFLVSYSTNQEKERLVFPSLVLATILSTYFISAGNMNEIFSLLLFSITFAFPLFLYWVVALQEEMDIRLKPIGIALSYVLFTALLFYVLPELLGISVFILSPRNRIPQTLMVLGSGMILAIPYHVILEIKN
ncbi:MAG: hypothetical protein KGY68_05030 [Candidatus Thermoplasmatota archaeon]|nr:hypothetical protein [Candidatus Thermoplasmatota archaeon]